MRYTGVTARGIVTPIFCEGDDIVTMVCDSLLEASKNEGFALHDGDIVAVTEAVLGRTQGNYATCDQIAADVRQKLGGEVLGVLFPIQSRNRFATLLKGIAQAAQRTVIQMAYPGDEVGNSFLTLDDIDAKRVNPYSDSFDEKGFRAIFGTETRHLFTGIDYIDYYKSLNPNIEVIFSNDPRYILKYTKNVLTCDIHTRKRTQRILREAGAQEVYRLDEILTESVQGSGFNPQYGLLGSNMATSERVKLFPRDADVFVGALQARLKQKSGKHFEVMVYGDGCFKDPRGGIWEFADPVVSPGWTDGLNGTPNEIKIKYMADNELAGLTGQALQDEMRKLIQGKEKNLVGNMSAQGTTPRHFTDLIGSLCDLVSGSGDRGTPVVLVQGYFTNYASE